MLPFRRCLFGQGLEIRGKHNFAAQIQVRPPKKFVSLASCRNGWDSFAAPRRGKGHSSPAMKILNKSNFIQLKVVSDRFKTLLYLCVDFLHWQVDESSRELGEHLLKRHPVNKRLFEPFLSCPLPQQPQDEGSLQQAQKNAANDVLFIRFPDCWLIIEQDTTWRQRTLFNSPAPQGSPIEHVDVGAFDDRNVLRPRSVENPEDGLSNKLAFGSETLQIATHLSMPQFHIRGAENRGVRSTRNHGTRLGRSNVAGSGGILSNVGV